MSLIQFSRAGCNLTPHIIPRTRNSTVGRNLKIYTRFISTSNKKKDPLTEHLVDENVIKNRKDIIPFNKTEFPKNWISYGFSYDNISDDNTFMHIIFFCTVTMCVVGCGFILMYQPDNRMLDWSKREAYLELRRREMEGLPLVDKDLISIDKVELPTDEELGDIKITI